MADYADVPLLAHRGLWTSPAERNTLPAIALAFEHGHGAELDVRDLDGALVVSHDPPVRGAASLAAVVSAYAEHECPGPIAVNVKADGLDGLLADALRALPSETWFAFDMSVPDMLGYARAGLPFFTRHSEIEPSPALYDEAPGVWLDDFAGGFITERRIDEHLSAGKRVAVVSPELHGRDHGQIWREWAGWGVWECERTMLCTDHPLAAAEVLYG